MNVYKLITATIIAILVFALFPQIDISVSKFFYKQDGGFIYSHANFSLLIYKSVHYATTLTLTISLFVVIYSLIAKFYPQISGSKISKIRNKITFTNRQIYFLLLVIIIMPGILVHWVIKPEWERARPRQVIEFGGDKQFSSFYNHGANQDGKSFPSGHSSMAFSLVALAFIVSKQRRKKIFIATFSYGSLVAMCRVWQGGHFVSDVTFSAILTMWVIYFLKRFYLERNFIENKIVTGKTQ